MLNEINQKIDTNKPIVKEYKSGNKEHVRFSIGDLYATSDFNGKLVVKIGDSVQSSTINALKGERIKSSILLPVIPNGRKLTSNR